MKKELKGYRDLFENAPIGIFQTTLGGNVIKANTSLASMLGYADQNDFMSCVRNIATDTYVDSEHRKLLLNQVLTQDRLLNFESRFKRKDGSAITGKVHIRVVRDDEGRVEYLEGFMEDISEQKKIAEALRRSEEYYRSIFENTGAGTIIIEDDMTISLANAGFEKLTGFSRNDLEGRMKWTEVVDSGKDRDMMVEYHRMRREKNGNVPTEYEFTLRDRQGKKRNIFLRVDMIKGTRKSVASLIDVTSHMQAERSLRFSESRLGGILEAFEGFIYTCTGGYRIDYMNQSLKKWLGSSDLAKPCHEIIYGLKKPCEWCAVNRVFEGETVKNEFRHPGNNRWYYAVNTPIFNVDDTVAGKQTVIIDIDDRKKAEAAIKEREKHLKKENIRLRSAIRDRYKFGRIVGKSPAMQKVYELVLRAAATDANVIIYGESGTGKELVARAIHDMSDRRKQRFVPVNCGAVPQHLLESEFFGYKKGAFTGAGRDKPGFLDLADKGTLFLDELGEIDVNIQVKLLRALDGGGFTPLGGAPVKAPDFRMIAATNRNLRKLVENGLMREDFFYRIHIIPIQLPPLRERKEDIPLLAEHFLAKHRSDDLQVPLSGKILDALLEYNWPGNVRELENTIQRFLNLGHLDFLDLPLKADRTGEFWLADSGSGSEVRLQKAMQRFEKQLISGVLATCRWNRTRAAGVLGIERKTLYLKMKKLGIRSS